MKPVKKETIYFIRTWISNDKNTYRRMQQEYNRVFYTKKECLEFLRSEGFRKHKKLFRTKCGDHFEYARIDNKY